MKKPPAETELRKGFFRGNINMLSYLSIKSIAVIHS